MHGHCSLYSSDHGSISAQALDRCPHVWNKGEQRRTVPRSVPPPSSQHTCAAAPTAPPGWRRARRQGRSWRKDHVKSLIQTSGRRRPPRHAWGRQRAQERRDKKKGGGRRGGDRMKCPVAHRPRLTRSVRSSTSLLPLGGGGLRRNSRVRCGAGGVSKRDQGRGRGRWGWLPAFSAPKCSGGGLHLSRVALGHTPV